LVSDESKVTGSQIFEYAAEEASWAF
jgi:hypothetical protein